MKVAVITPYYKEPRAWIERCIASVRHGTGAGWLCVGSGGCLEWFDADVPG